MEQQLDSKSSQAPSGARRSREMGTRTERLLSRLFTGNADDQLKAIALIEKAKAPLLLRAFLWKVAQDAEMVMPRIEHILEEDMNQFTEVLWLETKSPISKIRLTSVEFLKGLSGITEIRKFFPLLDDYDLAIREQTRNSIRVVVDRFLETLQQEQQRKAPPGEGEAVLNDFWALSKNPISQNRRFVVEMLVKLAQHFGNQFWCSLSEHTFVDPKIIRGELIRQADKGAREVLYNGLFQSETCVKLFVLPSLSFLFDREPLGEHLKQIYSFEDAQRLQVVSKLVRNGLFDHFISEFDELQPGHQIEVMQLIGLWETPRFIGFLRQCLSHRSPEIAARAIGALRSLGEKFSQSETDRMLRSNEPDVVLATLEFLQEEGTAEMIPKLVPLLEDPVNKVSQNAAECIARISQKHLFAKFDTLGNEARKQVTRVLYRLNPALIQEIGDSLLHLSSEEKVQSVRILLTLADEYEARVELERLLKDEDPKVRATAAKSLQHFSTEQMDDILLSLLMDQDARVRANALEEIPDSPGQRILDMLFELAQSRYGRERANALKKLHNLGYQSYELSVAQMVEDPDPYVRASGLWVVGQIRSAKLVQLAVERTRDLQAIVRRNAVKAIRNAGTDDQVRNLLPMAEDPDRNVRQEVAAALKQRVNLEVKVVNETRGKQ